MKVTRKGILGTSYDIAHHKETTDWQIS